MTDSSEFGTEGVLIEVDDDGGYRPVACTSRELKSAEAKYIATEKDCLAVLYVMKQWKHYLDGGETFTLMSDHEALKWLMYLREPEEGLATRMIKIQDYDFELEFDPGKLMKVPDILSADAVKVTKCAKCQERVVSVSSAPRSLSAVEQIRDARVGEFGDLEEFCDGNENITLIKMGFYVSCRIVVWKCHALPRMLKARPGRKIVRNTEKDIA